MTDLLFAPHMLPFATALGLLLGLLALELISVLIGGSLLGLGGEADIDLDADVDLGLDVDPSFDLDGDFDIDALEALDATEVDLPEAETDLGGPGLAGWLGMGDAPFLIWLGALLMAFGLSGVALQNALIALVGTPLPAWIAGPAMLVPGVFFAKTFSGAFARVLPKTETQSVSSNHLGRRRGIVSQGTAARGKPAEVRVYDLYGNTHYLRAEPLRDSESIPQGTEVLVLRKSLNEGYRVVALPD